MKYVILIHSNPEPWGHPTSDFLPEYQGQSRETRERLGAEFDTMLKDLIDRGELVSSEALGDPRTSRLFSWRDGRRVVTDGPFAEGREHLAGFFVIDVDSLARAEDIAQYFGAPGHRVELRPVMTP